MQDVHPNIFFVEHVVSWRAWEHIKQTSPKHQVLFIQAANRSYNYLQSMDEDLHTIGVRQIVYSYLVIICQHGYPCLTLLSVLDSVRIMHKHARLDVAPMRASLWKKMRTHPWISDTKHCVYQFRLETGDHDG